MSSNLSVINFAVGGTLTVSGDVTLSQAINSTNTASFSGLSTTSLTVSGASKFTSSLPTSSLTPSNNSELTTKIYVDNADGVLNSRITSTDSAQKSYIDSADAVLNSRITDTDSAQKTYIDTAIANVGTKPIFYAYQATSMTQSVSNNIMSTVDFFYILHNVLHKYTNGEYLFRPTFYGGYYQLTASVCLPNITSGYIAIFKNDVEFSRGTSFSSNTTSPDTTLTVSTVMYLNGNNDSTQEWADVRVICSPATVISGSISKTYFTGYFIQP